MTACGGGELLCSVGDGVALYRLRVGIEQNKKKGVKHRIDWLPSRLTTLMVVEPRPISSANSAASDWSAAYASSYHSLVHAQSLPDEHIYDGPL